MIIYQTGNQISPTMLHYVRAVNSVDANLDQRKMNNHGNCTAEDGIGTVFGTIPHGIMATISCYGDSILDVF